LQDVVHVGETMWARGIEELKYLGFNGPQWIGGWYHRIQRGDAVAFGPHAILGWDPEGLDVCSAFQASKSFEEPGIGFAVTKEMRREIPRLMKSRGVHRFNTYSLCIDPEAPKWFRLLGMEEDLNYRGEKRGPYTLRKFWREA
jgi:hypothetical protein